MDMKILVNYAEKNIIKNTMKKIKKKYQKKIKNITATIKKK